MSPGRPRPACSRPAPQRPGQLRLVVVPGGEHHSAIGAPARSSRAARRARSITAACGVRAHGRTKRLWPFARAYAGVAVPEVVDQRIDDEQPRTGETVDEDVDVHRRRHLPGLAVEQDAAARQRRQDGVVEVDQPDGREHRQVRAEPEIDAEVLRSGGHDSGVALVAGPRRCTVVRPPIRAKPIPGLTEAIELNSVAPSHSADQIRTSGPVGPLTMCLLSPTPGSEARSGETTRDRPPEPVEWAASADEECRTMRPWRASTPVRSRSAEVRGHGRRGRARRAVRGAHRRDRAGPAAAAPHRAVAHRAGVVCRERVGHRAQHGANRAGGRSPARSSGRCSRRRAAGCRRPTAPLGGSIRVDQRWSAVATTRLCGPASSRCSANRQPLSSSQPRTSSTL